ncbi:MAG: dUTP diphosphatase [Clostridiales Family XIII bacterium]|jgi:dUTP pyrophosphatase|nr:dUTP diphosphatase [Clostridiales Family XIII bacterium]
MILKIKTDSGFLPAYESPGAAGMDLRADIAAPITLRAGERALIPTGLSVALPQGCEAQVRARSGLAVKYGIGLVNGTGTIDSDYRGEIKVPLINWGDEDFVIERGDRIAQMIVARYERVEWEVAAALPETERGTGGFGHTGV